MKKLLTSLFALLAAMAFVACTQNEVSELSNERAGMPATFTVGFEGDDTRVELNEVLKTVWTEGDEVSIFYRSYENMRWAFQGATGDRSGELKLVSGEAGDQTMDNSIIVYPYSESYAIDADTHAVAASLPAMQSYKSGSYGADGNIMVAESSFTQFVLKSVVGWLRVEVSSAGKTVKSVTVNGNKGEQVAGLCYINAADASVTLAASDVDASRLYTEVRLDCGEGVELGVETTHFYVALLPQEYEFGVTIGVQYTDYTGYEEVVEYLNLERNHIVPVVIVEPEPVTDKWGIVGTFNEWGSNDIPMQYLAGRNMIVAYGVELEAGAQFKVRMNESWEYSYGPLGEGTLTANSHMKVTADSTNFIVSEDGVYDIYLDWDTMTLWFMESGVNPDDVKTFGICGSFNGWGETTDIEMTYDETNKIYYAAGVEFAADAEFKVRQNNLWEVNYGANYHSYIDVNSFKTAVSSGNNIRVQETGTYDIYFSEEELLIWFMESGVDRATAVEDLPDGWDGETTSEIRYTSSDGDIINPNNIHVLNVEILSNEYVDGEGVITFAGELTTIGKEAFYFRPSLTSITIPDSVTTIGDLAFASCYNLTGVTIPNSVTEMGIGAFAMCDNLKKFNGKFAEDEGRCLIVDGVLNSFAIGCDVAEYTIPDSVTTIGDFTFAYCYNLTSVTIGDNVTTIGQQAFYECNKLTSVAFGNGVTTIGNSAFSWCESLTSVTIPDSVMTIGNSAFYRCNSLTSVTIGNGVTTIGNKAFSYCNSLTSVTFGDNVTTLGDSAFVECDSLISVTIPDSVTTIGASAFSYCSSLTSVALSDSVTTIGGMAFSDCENLTSVTIGNGVTTIGAYAFAWCYSLTNVYCKATTPPASGIDVFDDNKNDRIIYVPTESVEIYKTAENWINYADSIYGYDPNDSSDLEDILPDQPQEW